ncbi:GNAT family N-acetyltransferase [Fodinicola feengrottensis]|uniref:GNAT family N-acetyltransferase n=1 Tax=Fodinicola feengrottensis TaxID=435914 RepID=UPI00244252E9|nr:GNAT family N-acetyltransferase [Fodinicola feengrottensis]
MSLRLAVPADVPALTALVRGAYEHYVPRIGREPAPMTDDYAEVVRRGHTWVAERAGIAVGMLVLVPETDHLLLENIAVRADAQGGGIGRLLLVQAESEAVRLGFVEVRLYTNAAMTENIAYYQRHGYVEIHRAGNDGFSRVFFSKVL